MNIDCYIQVQVRVCHGKYCVVERIQTIGPPCFLALLEQHVPAISHALASAMGDEWERLTFLDSLDFQDHYHAEANDNAQ